ncbi:ribosome silencing factor [Belnapia moabensis]|uniref:ribosome silencing factor n=1 Tax=Belnapia moabensis TaxID=365533 RepID=UPI0005BE6D62|nr:ribosome silencing factor [Belnapia moabensis]
MFGWTRKTFHPPRLDDLGQVFQALAARGTAAEASVARHVLELVAAFALATKHASPTEVLQMHRLGAERAEKWRQDAIPSVMTDGGDPAGHSEWASAWLIETWHFCHIAGEAAISTASRIADWLTQVLGEARTNLIATETWTERSALSQAQRAAEQDASPTEGFSLGVMSPEASEDSPILAASMRRALERGGARAVVAIDVSETASFTDVMVFATGQDEAHLRILTEIAVEVLGAVGTPNEKEMVIQDGDWILVDGGDTVIHILTHKERERLGLERMWG